MISEEDNEVLFIMGRIFKENLQYLVADTVFYGLFIGMFLYSTFLLIRRGNRVALIISIFAFSLSTAHWAASVSYDLMQITAYLQHNLDIGLSDRGSDFVMSTFPHDSISNWTGNLTPILSDITVLWRAYIIFPQSRIFLIFPGTCFVALIISTFYFNIARLNKDIWFDLMSGEDPNHIYRWQPAMFFLSFATNFMTTCFMGYKLWCHRKWLKDLLGKGQGTRGSESALGILLETGVVYCALQLALAILSVSPASTNQSTKFVAALFLTIYGQLSAMYPVAVIILVQLRLSISDALSGQQGNGVPIGTTMSLSQVPASLTRSRVRSSYYDDNGRRESSVMSPMKPIRFAAVEEEC